MCIRHRCSTRSSWSSRWFSAFRGILDHVCIMLRLKKISLWDVPQVLKHVLLIFNNHVMQDDAHVIICHRTCDFQCSAVPLIIANLFWTTRRVYSHPSLSNIALLQSEIYWGLEGVGLSSQMQPMLGRCHQQDSNPSCSRRHWKYSCKEEHLL
jgi:hypothetical protein